VTARNKARRAERTARQAADGTALLLIVAATAPTARATQQASGTTSPART
jgi:hypothetical protein